MFITAIAFLASELFKLRNLKNPYSNFTKKHEEIHNKIENEEFFSPKVSLIVGFVLAMVISGLSYQFFMLSYKLVQHPILIGYAKIGIGFSFFWLMSIGYELITKVTRPKFIYYLFKFIVPFNVAYTLIVLYLWFIS